MADIDLDELGRLAVRLERAEAVIAQIVKARRNHPECDRDETMCGWKRTVQDTDAALAAYQNGAAHDD